ncbi:hypothetical protein Nepgr_004127 [Nepenthes gracilis]|uniref:Uncharacterized protein n=1 Tax=Nepenthes gracilis TaxID=150966 RepID=A0AAD3S0R9_NEPGR|nr:hypothetical protein Nepgr_004127 [Nepenthes gracilis]
MLMHFPLGDMISDVGAPRAFPGFSAVFFATVPHICYMAFKCRAELQQLVDLVIGRFLLFVCVWLAVGNCLWSCFPPAELGVSA